MRMIMIAAVLALSTGMAWAQDNAACLKAAQPKLDAYGDCTVNKARVAAKGNDTPEGLQTL